MIGPRGLALVLAAALAPACTHPAAQIGAGLGIVIPGSLVLYDGITRTPDRDGDWQIIGKNGITAVGGILTTLGGMLLITGVLNATAHAEPPVPLERPSFAPPGSAAAVLDGRVDQLSSALQLEARAGHCEAATGLARRLAVLDRDRVTTLVERDAAVARCIATQRM